MLNFLSKSMSLTQFFTFQRQLQNSHVSPNTGMFELFNAHAKNDMKPSKMHKNVTGAT